MPKTTQNLNTSKPNALKHLAIIMDGNGRWAQALGKTRKDGHKAGAKVVRKITAWCAKNSISTLTLYAFSTENWKRPKAEVDFLMTLLDQYLKNEKKNYLKNGIRFRAIGDISVFNPTLQERIYELEELSKDGKNLTQILALNYGGRDEIARASLKAFCHLSSLELNNLDKNGALGLLQANLDVSTDIDLLIRTGGEMRISNFLLWQISYAELFFTQTLWPDFTSAELQTIIHHFQNKSRRFGGL